MKERYPSLYRSRVGSHFYLYCPSRAREIVVCHLHSWPFKQRSFKGGKKIFIDVKTPIYVGFSVYANKKKVTRLGVSVA